MPINQPVGIPLVQPVIRPIPKGFAGAYAEEVSESRIGLQTGMLGAQNATRTWRVYTASPGDNPIITMENLPSAHGGVSIGSTFPTTSGWGDGSFVLQYFTILDHWPGTPVWILQGTYVPSYLASLPNSLMWTFRISSSLEAKRLFVEIPWADDDGNLVVGRGIGAPRYVPRPELLHETINTIPPKRISVTNPAARFTAISLDPKYGTATVQLPDGSDNPRNPTLPRFMVGADVPTPSSVLTLTKKISKWDMNAVIGALNSVGKINADEFSVLTSSGQIVFANRPDNPYLGQMLFQDLQLDPIVNDEGGGEPAFQVTLTFGFSKTGWQHSIQHTHKWDDSTESQIRDDGGNVINETFHIVDPTFLSSVVSAFR
jgi:hypothetical protein